MPPRIPPSRLGSGSHRPGVWLTDKGYERYSAGPHRGRYVHRAVLATLCAEFCYYPVNAASGIPDGFTVEHLDHHRTHNCVSNLILLDNTIHRYLSWSSWLSEAQIGRVQRAELERYTDDNLERPRHQIYTQDEIDEVPF